MLCQLFLLVIGYVGFLIYSGRFAECITPIGQRWGEWLTTVEGTQWWNRIFIVHGILFFITVVLKFYSFRLNTWDTGIYNNIIFNISQGHFFSSFHNAHNFADHFTPSISFISLFYMNKPSIHWMMGFKVLAYALCPFLMYQIAKTVFNHQVHAKLVGGILGLGWLLFYAPAVRSLNFEFQSSCLAPPVILYAFLSLQKEQWIRFTIVMLFILGLKEHLGSVWIGMGCYLVLTSSRKKLGVLLIGGGTLALWLIIFQAMPYFRDYLPTWTMRISPFAFMPQKITYLVKLLFPFMFLPLVFWRYGILAGPAVGVNLVSGRSVMVSSSFHYDDVTSTLLFISMILCLRDIPLKSWYKKLKHWKGLQWIGLVWVTFCLFLLPPGPIKHLIRAIPTQMHKAVLMDIQRFNNLDSQEDPIAVQTSLGPHFFREHIRDVVHHAGGNCAEKNALPQVDFPVKYILLAPGLNHYMIHDIQLCIDTLEQSLRFRKLPNFKYLQVYENLAYRG